MATEFWAEVQAELERQKLLWPDSTVHEMAQKGQLTDSFGVLGEEWGEVVRAYNEATHHGGPVQNIHTELVQVAAVAVAWMAGINHEPPRAGEEEVKPTIDAPPIIALSLQVLRVAECLHLNVGYPPLPPPHPTLGDALWVVAQACQSWAESLTRQNKGRQCLI